MFVVQVVPCYSWGEKKCKDELGLHSGLLLKETNEALRTLVLLLAFTSSLKMLSPLEGCSSLPTWFWWRCSLRSCFLCKEQHV